MSASSSATTPSVEKPLLTFCVFNPFIVTWPVWVFGFAFALMNWLMPGTVNPGTAGTIWLLTVIFCSFAAAEDIGREGLAYIILTVVALTFLFLYLGSEYGWQVWPWLWAHLKAMQLEVPYKTIHIASWVWFVGWLFSLGNTYANNRWELYNKQLVRIVLFRRKEPFMLADTNLRFGVDDFMDNLLTGGGGHVHFTAGQEHVSGIILDYGKREGLLIQAQRTSEMSGTP